LESEMFKEIKELEITNDPLDVPIPILTFSRWVYFIIMSLSIATQNPWLITLLILLLIPSAIYGRKANLISMAGRLFLSSKIPCSLKEDRRLIQFNNLLLIIMLLLAQLFLYTGNRIVGWGLVLMGIAATGFALAGFCVGCVLYFRFKLYRYKFSAHS
jgi:hypothetical protein